MKNKILALFVVISVINCAPSRPPTFRVPSVEYAKRVKGGTTSSNSLAVEPYKIGNNQEVMQANLEENSPRARLVVSSTEDATHSYLDNTVSNLPQFQEYRSQNGNARDYKGPLALGDPGLTSSLWREASSGNDMFRDQRAFQPMDLLTIIVSETDKGSKTANTEVKETADVSASIANVVGLEKTIKDRNDANLDLTNLVTAATNNNFKGEGKTNREGSLTARISAMVAEVLPSGILRIEGEKIISVNNEEQVMVISGLVRPRDISSNNEVESSKIANMRIDYAGNGIIGEAQDGGWLSRAMRRIWPF